MNFSKLLCLVLVFSQQFGQVLLTEVQTTEDCTGDGSKTVTCQRKKGQKVILKITGSSNTKWMKGTITITASSNKYEFDDATNQKELTILNLKEGDEGEYTASTSPAQKFQVQVVDCLGGPSATPGLCQGKPGGRIKLGLEDGTVSSIGWKKDTEKITADSDKYPGGVDKATLTIMNLDDDDDAKFTGGTNGDGEYFSVQVADCFGGEAGSTVKCEGKLGKPLKLRISGSVTTSTVTWEKEGGTLPEGNVKKGTKNEGLILDTLEPADAGTYKATYDSKTVSFTVSFPDPKGTNEGGSGGGGSGGSGGGTTKKPTTTGGGGRGSTTDTVVVHDNSGGSGSVLSYSPALLVTVTLVHLLLQLAA